MNRMLLLAFMTLTLYAVGNGATVTISPVLGEYSVGAVLSLSVDVSDVVDLYSYQFNLSFDPSVLSGIDVIEGTLLGGGGLTFFSPGIVDNVSGSISFTAGVLIGAVPGVTGDGTLAVVRLAALAPGVSDIGLSNLILLDSNLADIAADSSDGSVTITQVPEPQLHFVVLTAAAVLLLTYRYLPTRSDYPNPRSRRHSTREDSYQAALH